MAIDLLIQNGHMIDPARGIDAPGDIAISAGKIVGSPQGQGAALTADATDCIVLPGLIDFHTHLYDRGSGFGLAPDLLFSTGVTSAVDAGSCGCANFAAFYHSVAATSHLHIRSMLNLVPCGQVGYGYQEKLEPGQWTPEVIRDLMDRYPGQIIGLKLRVGRPMLGSQGALPIRRAKEIGAALELPLCLHVTDSPLPAGEIASLLGPGDIYCHVYHNRGGTALAQDGGVSPALLEARERGVIFDAANGRSNFSFAVASRALEQGFAPDIISTDATPNTLNVGTDVKSLPHLMSKYLALGMTLPQVVARTTQIPAGLMGQAGQIGTLAPGARGDVTVCRVITGDFAFSDADGTIIRGDQLLVPQMTVSGGKVRFCQADFIVK